jgi:AraC-like DNA-binding protein
MSIENNELFADFVNNLHIRIVDSGYASLDRSWSCSRVCSPFSRIYLIHSGEGSIHYGQEHIVLQESHIYLIPSGLTFEYARPDFMRQLYFHVIVLTPDGCDLLSGLEACYEYPDQGEEIENLVRLYRSRTLADAVCLHQAIYRCIAVFISRSSLRDKPMQAFTPFLSQLYALVRQSPGIRTSIAGLAEKMMMPSRAMARHFKEETGMTLGKYMDLMLFQKIQQMLLLTDLTIGQIAENLGFCDQFYLSRYFKQHQQELPSHYRKRLRGRI